MTDTGPPYPHPNPAPGSNAIGSFVIGVSPIGSIPPFDWWKTVVSQYANAPALTAILESFFDCLDQTADLDAFFDDIWNVDTAQGYGLDVWGRIVGVTRIVPLPGSITFLAFQESGDPDGWNNGIWFSGTSSSSSFVLSDDAYRLLIFTKALANITDGSIKALNAMLRALFPGRGNAYVTDPGGMAMTYTFAFKLSPVELSIVQNSGALPKPVGVSVTIVQPP
jgi:Protein of unknown function (DUF2612)